MTQTNGSPVWSSTHSLPSRMPPSSTDVSRRACRSMASAVMRSRKIGRSSGPGTSYARHGPAAVAVGPAQPLGLAIPHVVEDDLVLAQRRCLIPLTSSVLQRLRPSPRHNPPVGGEEEEARLDSRRRPGRYRKAECPRGQRPRGQRRILLDRADDLGPARLVAVRADGLGHADTCVRGRSTSTSPAAPGAFDRRPPGRAPAPASAVPTSVRPRGRRTARRRSRCGRAAARPARG